MRDDILVRAAIDRDIYFLAAMGAHFLHRIILSVHLLFSEIPCSPCLPVGRFYFCRMTRLENGATTVLSGENRDLYQCEGLLSNLCPIFLKT